MKHFFPFCFCAILWMTQHAFSQTIYEPLRPEELEWDSEDFGHMWTFDAVPADDYEQSLDFKPSQDWLDDVKKSALQFGGGCSGSFVSGSGLIMTNHHCCRRYILRSFENGGEILQKGYYADSLKDEVKMKGLYVDQLIGVKNITDQVIGAMDRFESPADKALARDSISELLRSECEDGSGLVCRVVKLYQGGKYSLYSYKRYDDIRLVMAPSFQLASTGWDWDNYTYPRYELDMAFFRAYDSLNNPIVANNFFQWNSKGAAVNEPVFVVGKPGATARLISFSELDFLKDVSLPILLNYYNARFEMHFSYFEMHPEKASELFSTVLSVSNGRKRYAGRYIGVKDQMLRIKKFRFEEDLKKSVAADPKLSEKYGDLWQDLDITLAELTPITQRYYSVYLPKSYLPSVFNTARNLIEYAEEMKRDPEDRSKLYSKENLANTKSQVFSPPMEKDMDSLKAHFINAFWNTLNFKGKPKYFEFFDQAGKSDPYQYLLSITELDDPKAVKKLLKGKPEKILNSEDPVIRASMEMKAVMASTEEKRDELLDQLSIQNQMLGELIFSKYGDTLPPDGTGTLRISEGRVRGYEYNGTLAPPKTTFYGLYDRYNSFGKKPYPWGLDDYWAEPTPGFDLATPINFVSTTDIVGGNSGSAIINRNAEVIGLAFDGNLEGISGYYMYLPDKNRTVGVDSKGMIESLRTVYKYSRLTEELESGGIK